MILQQQAALDAACNILSRSQYPATPTLDLSIRTGTGITFLAKILGNGELPVDFIPAYDCLFRDEAQFLGLGTNGSTYVLTNRTLCSYQPRR